MAATFVDLAGKLPAPTTAAPRGAPLKPDFGLSGSASDHWYRAVRIAAEESSKKLARVMHPEIENKNRQQMLAYREMKDDDLFSTQWVKVEIPPKNSPATKATA
jgi:formylmethanofuran dehydrogenase subunit E